jgi:low temperature requirement protein LtrA
LLLVGAFFHGSARESVWAAAAVIDLSTPTVLRRRLRGMHFDAPHLAERFGLFVLIALGESVVAIGAPAASEGEMHGDVLASVATAFVLSCGLWWVYFHFALDAVRHALATAEVQVDITRRVLSYGHLSFIASIIVAAAGMGEVVARPSHDLSAATAVVLFGGCAAYLATFGYTRWRMFRLMSWTRLTAAAVVLVLLPLAPHLPGIAALAVLAAVVVGLNVWEARRVRRASML